MVRQHGQKKKDGFRISDNREVSEKSHEMHPLALSSTLLFYIELLVFICYIIYLMVGLLSLSL